MSKLQIVSCTIIKNAHIIIFFEQAIYCFIPIIKQPGAQKKLTDEQETELLSVISTQTPEEAGMGVFANWTAALACAFVEQKFGVLFSSRGMLNLFERLGLTYTRPTYGKHEGVKLVGILDYETGHVYVEEHKKYDAEVFLQFLKNVLSKYQDGKIHHAMFGLITLAFQTNL